MGVQACRERGVSLLELVFTLAAAATVAAIAVPMTSGSLGYFRVSGDARGVSNSLAVAKMRAAAHFTRARLFVDLAGGSYRVESWDKDGAAWVPAGALTELSPSVAFGPGGFEEPPPDTQAVIGQAPPCRDDGGVEMAETACIVFNSRGVPVDATGAPTASGAVYLESGTTVYAATIAATGLVRLWRADSAADGTWVQQ